ncbi:hypothetical protein M8998_07145 [Sphingobacterium sp. lm-10]|uniref:hypothetical protein n=1 Tax=Sphingobacterium sp. lm-10 TaxID=2944904 RepID=UPI00202233AC|nr:hypothetical protein [Sphingobacterium sp. lm-10]MCL7987709.1 hypothetical protein [Sphingobacterium sp. lm-10]
MPKIYIEVPIAERMPVVGEKQHPLDKVVFVDNCNVRHAIPLRLIELEDRQHLMEIGYTHWLEEVEVSEEVLELVKGGSSCK